MSEITISRSKKGLPKNSRTSAFWLTIKHNVGLETVDTVTGTDTSLYLFMISKGASLFVI